MSLKFKNNFFEIYHLLCINNTSSEGKFQKESVNSVQKVDCVDNFI